jgi:TRAP-type mannitol/chloroaromatic compound transport system substrate-binding protein
VGKALCGAAGVGGLAAGCAPQAGTGGEAAPGARVVWRLASSFPPGLDTIFGASTVLAERLKQITDGRFQIHVSGAGEIVPGLQVMDAVQSGSVQVGHTAGYYYIGKNPALAFDTCLPFGLTARQQQAWLYQGGGLELLRKVYADFNIVNFPGGNTGAQMGGWFRREIQGLADLKGLKMRIPGMGGKVMDRLGVSVQVLAGPEIYPALERSAIDATEWVGPYDDEKLGFHKVAPHYYYPGWWEPGPNLSFLVNQNAWAKLPAAYQAAFEAATHEACTTMLTRYDAQNPAALRRLLDHGVQLHPFSHEILQAASHAFDELVQAEADNDAQYATIYQAWKQFRQDAIQWFGTAELAFTSFMTPPPPPGPG